MTTIRGVAQGFLCAVIALLAACGDNIHPGGGTLVVTPQQGLHTSESGGTATFTVALSSAPAGSVVLDLSSSNLAEGTVSPATLTFDKSNFGAAQTVTVTGVDDVVVDGNQAYRIKIAPSATAKDDSIGEVDVSLTNDDDDVAKVLVTPNTGLVTTAAGGTATFDVRLTSKPAGAVTVPLVSSNTAEGTIDMASVTLTDADWDQAHTVTITGVDDGLNAGNVAYQIVTGQTQSADPLYASLDPDDVFVTNLNRALVSIEVNPTTPMVALGTAQQFSATGIFDDNSTLDVTQVVTWSSSLTNIATESNANGTRGLATSHAIGQTEIAATFQGKAGHTTLTVTAAALTAINVTPTNPTIARGTGIDFTATGTYSDQTTQDLTQQVLWTSGDTAVATISNAAGTKGRATGVDPGMSTITASLNGVQGSTVLTVTAAALVSIDVTPVNPSIAKGSTQQFVATGVYSDGTTQPLTASATWASTDGTVATVSNAPGTKGLASTAGVGSTTISATSGGITGSTLLTVTAATLASIEVTPTNPSTTKGSTVQLTATATYTDGTTQNVTTQVTWASNNQPVATVSNANGSQGLATANAVGQATISASLGGITGSTILTVSPATLVSLQVSPTNKTTPKGTTVQYTATAFFSDNTSQDVTTQAVWSSSTGAVATISNAAGSQGLASAVGTGSTTIGATFGGMSASTTLTVTAAVLVAIQVTPTNPSIPKGTNLQFTATAVYSDGSTQNVTASSTWASSNTTVATIGNANGNRGRATAQNTGTSTITATFSGVSGTTTLTVTAATLQSIAVTPANSTAAKGTTKQFTATGTYSDGTTQNLTTQVTWTSSTTSVATISNAAGSQGLASALTQGTTTISATFGGRTGSTTLTVTAASLQAIQVTPTNPSAAKGTTMQFIATGIYSDGTSQNITTQVTWGSTAQNVATVSNAVGSQGLATAVDVGTSSITANVGAVTGSTTLTVTAATLSSIQVTPANPSIAKGSSLQLTATGVYSDGSTQDLTTQATWTTTNVGVAAVSNAAGSQGLATSVDVGTTTIGATFGGQMGTTQLTVTAAALASIQVTPANPSIAKGTTLQFTATGVYTDNTTQDLTTQVSWSSSTGTVATISNAAGSQGLANAADVGSTTITAAVGGKSGSTTLTVTAASLVSIQVTPTNPSIAKGTSLPFTAIGTYTDSSTQDLTTQATWSSSNIATATESNAAGSQGLATAVGVGTTTISATFGGKTGSTTLTVTPATLVSITVTPTNPSIAKGTTQQFTATGTYTDGSSQDLTATATWTSTTSTVATVSNAAGSEGFASAVDVGTTTISATAGGKTGSTTLTVTPATLVSIGLTPINPTIALGTNQAFIAIGTYSDGSTQDLTTTATWSSTNVGVATISNAQGSQGLASSVGEGSTTISATSGGMTGSTTLTVTMAALVSIQVTPTNPSAAKGTTQPFTATGVYTDGSSQDLTASATWSSSNTNVATVTNSAPKGVATAVDVGSATISATFGGKTGSTTLTVTAATLSSIVVTPANVSIAKGTTLQYTATGIYSDGSQQDLTATASWSSSNSAAATVAPGGLAAAVDVGSTTISANAGGKTGSTTLTVTAATLVSIDVEPTNPSIANGTTQQFTANGIYTDGSTQDLTTQVAWSSSLPAIATISNSPGSQGLATGTGNGSTTITATLSGKTGSTTLTVTGVVLTSVVVTPVNPTMAKGTTLQFTCTGVYSDNSTQDLTATALWASTNTASVAVSNAAGSQGLATAVDVGTADISCAAGGFTDTSTATVTGATITSIAISPANATIAAGLQVPYTAVVTYSNGVVADITASATWTSSNTAAATISNQAGNEGVATTVAPGTTTITANFGGSSGSTTLTVTNATCVTVSVTPVNPSIAKGTQLQFLASCQFSDSTTADITAVATWTSSVTTIASISNAGGTQGVATGNAAGTTQITATYQGKSAATTLTVTNATLQSIEITPANPTVAAGGTIQLQAIGHFSDGSTQILTTQCSWTSSNKFIAKVSQARRKRGLVTGVSAGSVTISATTLGVTGTTTVTVQ